MEKKRSQKKWIKPRHRLMRGIGMFTVCLYVKLRYRLNAEKFDQKGRPYLVLFNHQTPSDQFFVEASFSEHVYFIASEDIFSNGLISSLLRWSVAPIPIKKQTTDVNAVKTCIRVAREGGTIGIAPEGNRTYSGRTEYINPAIGGLAKRLGLPIALYRIEGGYGVQPRWSDGIRKGKIHAYVSRVIEPEEYKDLSPDELCEVIREGLQVNEDAPGGLFESEKRAEFMERAIYVCPDCGLAEFESSGNVTRCKKCGKTVEYGADKQLRGCGCDFPFTYFAEWYDYQKDFINKLDVTALTAEPVFRDTADIYEVRLYKRKLPLRKKAAISLYGDRIVTGEGGADEKTLPFSELEAASVLGRNKLNLYHGGKVYQFKGGKSFNALKYVNFYYRYKNITKGTPEETYLGI
ncbi:MAG: 1-acyl-sn-glycerol-3-phosphate acyltransferase [Firmicutes bacterium]|nr:1-acyl-sn-glycerol-3-phosphate acyltransferase [Bacillota bacterium]